MRSTGRFTITHVLRLTLLAGLASFATASEGAAILWNQLGSAQEVLNSAYGPNLSFYNGYTGIDAPANPAYVPGVFGNGLTIGPGNYFTEEREHNVVWNNLNQYLNPDRGTISVWYKQNADPVAYSYGVYRIFDGAYGLNAGIGLNAGVDPTPNLYFSINFGGASSTISYNPSAFNGTWIHLGAVWDRAGIGGSSEKMRLYVNGTEVAASTFGGWGSTVGTQADIGGGNDAGIAGQFAIDNLQVYDTALTDFSGRFVEAIPEPATWALALPSALLLGYARARRQQHRQSSRPI